MSNQHSDEMEIVPFLLELARLSQALTELDEAVQHLRNYDDPWAVGNFTVHLNKLERYVDVWQQCDSDLEETDHELTVASRSITRAYRLTWAGSPLGRLEALALVNEYNDLIMV